MTESIHLQPLVDEFKARLTEAVQDFVTKLSKEMESGMLGEEVGQSRSKPARVWLRAHHCTARIRRLGLRRRVPQGRDGSERGGNLERPRHTARLDHMPSIELDWNK